MVKKKLLTAPNFSDDSKSSLSFKDTSQIFVPEKLIEQVIGQENSVKLVRKAAAQKRNVLLVGIPGTGKSLIAQAMSEILPVQKLQDILVYPNYEDPNNPKIRVTHAGDGKKILDEKRLESKKGEDTMRMISFILPIGWMLLASIFWQMGWYSDVIFAALLLIGAVLLIGLSVGGQMRSRESVDTPKLLINNLGKKIAPFFEGTGSRAGALLGDVRHDPLQCFEGKSKLYIGKEGQNGLELSQKSMKTLWSDMKTKYPELIEKHENGYEAIMLPNEEQVFTVGEKDGKPVLSRILSLNIKPFEGEMTELNVEDKKLPLTPEHKVITKKDDKEAEKVSEKDILFKLE
jgi:ATP-dependent Lon protease